MSKLGLILRVPPQKGTDALFSFGNFASRYRHSIRWQGGFWEATWEFRRDDKAGITAAYLREWFENYLYYRVEERAGNAVTWEGLVWDMTLTLNGYKERRSVGDVWNAIKCQYVDTSNAAQDTGWSINQSSIDRYERRELILRLSNKESADADARVATVLTEAREAWARVIDINVAEPDSLRVTAVGDIYTANNRYVTAATGSTIADHITNIIGTDCDRLTAGQVATNSIAAQSFDMPRRGWDALLELTQIGDASGNPYRLWVTPTGLIHYQQADNSPAFYWYGRSRGLQIIGDVSPWAIQPGVIRNLTSRPSLPIPGSFLADSRDSWVQAVEISTGLTAPILLPDVRQSDSLFRRQEMSNR